MKHSNPIFDSLQILKFEHAVMLQLFTFIYECFHDISSVYFRTIISCFEDIRQIGSRQARRVTIVEPFSMRSDLFGIQVLGFGRTFLPI